LYDQFLGPETIEELWQAWDKPLIERYRHGHVSLLMDGKVLARTAEFIRTMTRQASS